MMAINTLCFKYNYQTLLLIFFLTMTASGCNDSASGNDVNAVLTVDNRPHANEVIFSAAASSIPDEYQIISMHYAATHLESGTVEYITHDLSLGHKHPTRQFLHKKGDYLIELFLTVYKTNNEKESNESTISYTLTDDHTLYIASESVTYSLDEDEKCQFVSATYNGASEYDGDNEDNDVLSITSNFDTSDCDNNEYYKIAIDDLKEMILYSAVEFSEYDSGDYDYFNEDTNPICIYAYGSKGKDITATGGSGGVALTMTTLSVLSSTTDADTPELYFGLGFNGGSTLISTQENAFSTDSYYDPNISGRLLLLAGGGGDGNINPDENLTDPYFDTSLSLGQGGHGANISADADNCASAQAQYNDTDDDNYSKGGGEDAFDDCDTLLGELDTYADGGTGSSNGQSGVGGLSGNGSGHYNFAFEYTDGQGGGADNNSSNIGYGGGGFGGGGAYLPDTTELHLESILSDYYYGGGGGGSFSYQIDINDTTDTDDLDVQYNNENDYTYSEVLSRCESFSDYQPWDNNYGAITFLVFLST